MMGDQRNYLYRYYAEFLERYKPKYFVFENVTGLLSATDHDNLLHLDKMLALFRVIGYETEFKTLRAEDYGILQSRKRVILVGKRGRRTGFYPQPEKWTPNVQVSEVFTDLPKLNAGEGNIRSISLNPYNGSWLRTAGIRNGESEVTLHQARTHTEQDLEIYRIAVDLWNQKESRLEYDCLPERLKTHKNRKSFTDRFKVVAANLAHTHTVVAHIAKDGHYYIHPDIEQNRSLTPREAARLQTFPDDYYFESASGRPSRTPAYRQIGNAVPVLLAEKIARKLMEIW